MPTRLSDEQEKVQKCMVEGYSCISDSVPGSGKTTTGIEIAKKLPSKKILSITFSSPLKAEGRARVRNMKNIEIQSYNSWILKYYGKGGNSKEEIYDILRDNIPIVDTYSDSEMRFDILILDETQDMNILFYQMVIKFVKDCRINPQYLVIGDQEQGVFEFLGADRRFLTFADQLFTSTFKRCPLTRSFRLTDNMSLFMNEAILGDPRIITDNSSEDKVEYLITDTFNTPLYEYIYNTICSLMDQGYKLDDFFILFAGMNSNTPAVNLDRYLSRRKLAIGFFDSESDGIGENEMKHKIVMTTFHKSKGRERPFVFVFNMDSTYFQYYKRHSDPSVCPPELYVALTRATKKLWVIQGYAKGKSIRQLSFFKLSLEELKRAPYCKLKACIHKSEYHTVSRIDGPIPPLTKHQFEVTELINYLTDDCENELYPLVNSLVTVSHRADGNIVAPEHYIHSDLDTSEIISDLVGIAVPSFIGHTLGIKGDIHRSIGCPHTPLIQEYDKIHNPPDSIEDHLRFANISKSERKCIHSNLRQINRYTSIISDDNLTCCVLNSKRITLTNETRFEVPIQSSYRHKDYGYISVSGVMDSLCSKYLYEFKCTGELQFSHKVQLIVYMWLLRQQSDYSTSRESYLFNFFTGELLRLEYCEDTISKIMDKLFRDKFTSVHRENDREFVKSCQDISESQKHTIQHDPHVSCAFLSSSDEED